VRPGIFHWATRFGIQITPQQFISGNVIKRLQLVCVRQPHIADDLQSIQNMCKPEGVAGEMFLDVEAAGDVFDELLREFFTKPKLLIAEHDQMSVSRCLGLCLEFEWAKSIDYGP
jgi:hypothetical protein